ncbi:putative reverse transcriptase domain-containing protein [Tanacetum coccineum]
MTHPVVKCKQAASSRALRRKKANWLRRNIFKLSICKSRVSSLWRNTLKGFGSIADGLDHVNPVIRLPIEHGISRVLGGFEITGNIGQTNYSYSGLSTLETTNETMDTMAGVDINTLTMEQYLALARGNQAPGVDAVMLCIFPFTLTGAAKRWVDRLTPGTINTWDLLKKAFIQRSIGSNSNTNRLVAIVSKLDNLGSDMKKLKKNVYANQVGCQICEGPHPDKEFPLNEEVKGVEEINDDETSTRILQCQFPSKELNPRSFTLPFTIGSFNFYAMADLGASVNVMPRSIYEYLKLANLRNTKMLVEMADMTKKAPLGIVENILVRIDKFLFPLDFVIIDKTPNETIILGRPFLATIHAEINVFDKEISLGIDNDRVNYDMEKKDHNFTTPTEKIFMIKSDLDNRPQSPAYSNNRSLNSERKYQDDNLVWDDRYAEWCDVSPAPGTSSQESNKPRPRDYTFREWTFIKVGHTDNVRKDITYWCHDHGFEEDKRDEMGIEIEEYDPPEERERIKVQGNDPERVGGRRL